MKKIEFYILAYPVIPGGKGRIEYRVQGEAQNRLLGPLGGPEFAAIAAVLSCKNVVLTPAGMLVSSDRALILSEDNSIAVV